MAQIGTIGFYENGKYKAWGIQAGDWSGRDGDAEIIIKNHFSPFYQYIKKHGEQKFKDKILEHPRGYMYPEFDVEGGELKGDGDAWEWGREDPDDESVLETEFSPYVNIWLDIDDKTINIKTKYGETFSMSYDKKHDVRKGMRRAIIEIMNDEFDYILDRYDDTDLYVFLTQYQEEIL